MDGLNKPPVLTFRKDKADEWQDFERQFDNYIAALHYDKPEASKAAILLNLAGPEAQKKAQTFVFKNAVVDANGDVIQEQESIENVEDLKNKFKEVCNVTKNTIMERHAFNIRKRW